MNSNSLKLLSGVLVAAGIAVAPAGAASIIFNTGAGQLNIDGDDDGTVSGDGWRTASFAKPGDIDGDNILGTDGWHVAYNSISNPDYAVTTTFTTNRVNGGGSWDNPSATAGPLVPDNRTAAFIFNNGQPVDGDVLQIVITNNDLVGQTLRLGVLYDVRNPGTGSFALTQTVGSGSGTATTPTLSYDGLSLDVAFFDITGAVSGDTFVLSTTGITGEQYAQLAGVTFDTAAVPEPPAAIPEPSAALLGGLGVVLLVCRRR